jgi:hypothetical protein
MTYWRAGCLETVQVRFGGGRLEKGCFRAVPRWPSTLLENGRRERRKALVESVALGRLVLNGDGRGARRLRTDICLLWEALAAKRISL